MLQAIGKGKNEYSVYVPVGIYLICCFSIKVEILQFENSQEYKRNLKNDKELNVKEA